MKGLILSGGKGTRLRPITHTNAKQLVPIANKPILFYGIEALKEAGIKDIGIVVGETKKEIISTLKENNFGINFSYIEQEMPLGLAHAVKISQPYLQEETFVMYLGDNLILEGIKKFVEEFINKQPNALILLTPVEHPEQFGVAELNKDKIIRLVEKPKHPQSNLALVGVYIFDYHIFKAVNAIKSSFRGELEITDAIQFLIEQGLDVQYHIIKGWWKDTGKLEDILEANRIVLDTFSPSIHGEVDKYSKIIGKVVIEEKAKISNSYIRGPAIIGKNTVISDSYIGPFTSIYYNCEIYHSEIEHSIVLEESIIKDIGSRIEDSLIGKNVFLTREAKKPLAYRLMVGDNSLIQLI